MRPTSAQKAAAAALAALAQAGKRVRIGGAAKGDLRGAELWLSSAGFNGITKFALEDLYVTVGAGTPLADLQAFLAEQQMQAPLASPWAEHDRRRLGGDQSQLAPTAALWCAARFGDGNDGSAGRWPRHPCRAQCGQECGGL